MREATNRLLQVVIPQFAKKLQSQFQNSNSIANANTRTTMTDLLDRVLSDMHRHGINMRYLGLIRSHLSPTTTTTTIMTTNSIDLSSLLFTEIVCRSVKNLIRQQMRELRAHQELDYIKLLVSRLNSIISLTTTTTTTTLATTTTTTTSLHDENIPPGEYWMKTIIPYIERHYERAFIEPMEKQPKIVNDNNSNNNKKSKTNDQSNSTTSHNQTNNDNDNNNNNNDDTDKYEYSLDRIYSNTHIPLFLTRLQTLLGFKLYHQCIQRMEYSSTTNHTNNTTINTTSSLPLFITENDIEELQPVIKHIHRVFFEEGTALSRLAASKSSDELFEQAGRIYITSSY